MIAALALAVLPALYVPVGDGGPVVIQVNAPDASWGIRQAARRLDAQLEGVTIRTAGDCATADACVTVVVGWYEHAEERAVSGGLDRWAGLTTYPSPSTRTVYLNRRAAQRQDRRGTAAHELGHVLGLAHHDGPGVMDGDGATLTLDEAAVLNTYYAAP